MARRVHPPSRSACCRKLGRLRCDELAVRLDLIYDFLLGSCFMFQPTTSFVILFADSSRYLSLHLIEARLGILPPPFVARIFNLLSCNEYLNLVVFYISMQFRTCCADEPHVYGDDQCRRQFLVNYEVS